MKQLITFLKSLFTKSEETSKTYTEVKKEAEVYTKKIIAALDEVKETAPKKKKRYYKPKN